MHNKLLFPITLLIFSYQLSTSTVSSQAKPYFAQAESLKKDANTAQAIAMYKKVIDLDPECIDAYRELSTIFKKRGQLGQAAFYLEQAIAHEPHNITTNFNLGCIYLKMGKIEKAIQAFRQICRYSPRAVSALYNIGYTLKTAGRVDEAILVYKEVLKKDPHYDAAHLALGFAYLSKGDFDRGWKQHERYLKRSKKNADKLRTLLREKKIKGKTILLHPEGGLGDTLLFIRYAQRLKAMGATVIAIVQKPLIPLLSHCSYIDKLLPSGTSSLPSYDASSTLMSLPAVFNDNEETFPHIIPYLTPNPTLVSHWKNRLTSNPATLKIGICWQADVKNDVSRLPIARRGIPLTQFYCLASIPHLQFYSLQKYDGVEQLKTIPPDFSVHIFDDDFDKKHGSFMDTAAVMEHMDLIITVDTAIAHLAGALGRPVWLLLPYSTDWRWIVNRTDSPWYPTMRIFKQPAPFDWDNVMTAVYHELEEIQKNR